MYVKGGSPPAPAPGLMPPVAPTTPARAFESADDHGPEHDKRRHAAGALDTSSHDGPQSFLPWDDPSSKVEIHWIFTRGPRGRRRRRRSTEAPLLDRAPPELY